MGLDGELRRAENGPELQGERLAWCLCPCTCGGRWCWGRVDGSASGWAVSEVHVGKRRPLVEIFLGSKALG